MTTLSAAAAGEQLLETTVHFTRDSLVRYAGASGDFNPIHYRDDIATEVGLPGVLAHGMLTMGAAIQPVIDLLGDPGRVLDYQAHVAEAFITVNQILQLKIGHRIRQQQLQATILQHGRIRGGRDEIVIPGSSSGSKVEVDGVLGEYGGSERAHVLTPNEIRLRQHEAPAGKIWVYSHPASLWLSCGQDP